MSDIKSSLQSKQLSQSSSTTQIPQKQIKHKRNLIPFWFVNLDAILLELPVY